MATPTTNILYGPEVVELILRKPEFLFLKKYYNLLYQALIPNCVLAINILKEHLEISHDTVKYILDGRDRRVKCQRVLGLLIIHLENERDFMKFCNLFYLISVLTDVQVKLITEFRANGNWGQAVPVLPGLLHLHKSQVHVSGHKTYTSDNTHAVNFIARSNISQLAYTCSINNSTVYYFIVDGASDDRAVKCCIGSHYQVNSRRRRIVTSQASTSLANKYLTNEVTASTPESSSSMPLDSASQRLSFVPAVNSPRRQYREQSVFVVSQPSSSAATSSDIVIQSSPVTTLSVVECLATSSGIATSSSGSVVSIGAATAVMSTRSTSTTSNYVTSGGAHNLHSHSTPVSADLTLSAIPSAMLPSITSISSSYSRNVDSLSQQGTHVIRSRYDDILQSLPTNYERTLDVVQDHLTDDQICSVLTSPNHTVANKIMLDSLVRKAESDSNILNLCDQLEQIKMLIADPTTIADVIIEIQASVSSQSQVSDQPSLPQSLDTNKDFTQLKAHYDTILKLMPVEYEMTVGKLQNYLGDDQICAVLSSSNSTIANKVILDCLIEKMSGREDLLDLCNQLELISTSEELKTVINEIRSGIHKSIQSSISSDVTINTQSNNQQHDSMPPSVSFPLYEETFSRISLDSDSKVVMILKKNYARLCQCLPQDYVQTIARLQQLFGITDQIVDVLTSVPIADVVNEKIISRQLVLIVKSDVATLQFCDVMDKLVVDQPSTTALEMLRNELLEAFSTPPLTDISTASTSTPTTTGVLLPTDVNQTYTASFDANTVRASSADTTTTINMPQAITIPKVELQEQLRYQERQLQKGIKYLQPPPLPPNHVSRQNLLEEIATKLYQAALDPNNSGTTLTITGAGGFGKTTIVTSLCYHPAIKEQFTDGFLFVTLGPQATDPNIRLRALYNLLTNEHCDINVAEQKIRQLTSAYYRNLLVIIDDVWHVEDAVPIVKAFSASKIILTTRMNDVEQYIPSKQTVTVGPMELSEAITLLTCKVIDSSQLSGEDLRLLEELAQDVHLWPLLLSLVRGQLSHNLKQYRMSYHKAIQTVQARLHDKGLTAFDRNNMASVDKCRHLAVKACIEMTLEMLSKSLSNKVKTLILYTGIGTSLQVEVLNALWSVSKQESKCITETLWSYGIVRFTNIKISRTNSTQNHLGVHAVISQYIIESMDSEEVSNLHPHGKTESIMEEIDIILRQSHGVDDPSSLTVVDYLKYRLSEIENLWVPSSLKQINMFTVTDPHLIIFILKPIQDILMISPTNINFLLLLREDIKSLTNECKQILRRTHNLCRELNQLVEKNIQAPDKAIKVVEEFIINYPVCKVAQKAASVIKKILPYFDGKLLHDMKKGCEVMQMRTRDYHDITTRLLPHIKLHIKLHQKVNTALLTGSPYTEQMYHYIRSGKFEEEEELVHANYLIKLQEVAPNFVHEHA